MATITQELLRELECPVCLEYFQPPIMVCANGHSTCKKCKIQVNSCPICRAAFLNVRNHALEKVMSKISSPCKYHTFGCNVTFPMDDIIAHEIICPHRPYKCPVVCCTWNRPLNRMSSHLKFKHTTSVRAETGKSITPLRNFGITFPMKYLFMCLKSEPTCFIPACFTLDLRTKRLGSGNMWKSAERMAMSRHQ